MARKAYYDRNPLAIVKEYSGNLSAHDWTIRFTYEVPTDRTAFHTYLYGQVYPDINLAGKYALLNYQIDAGDSFKTYNRLFHTDTSGYLTSLNVATPFILLAGHKIRCQSFSDDDVDHQFKIACLLTEFDE